VRYRILGPVELYEDGRRIPIGGRRQVALLAYLLIHRNRPASTDALIDAVWGGGRAPDAALKSVQVAIGRLRKSLPDGPNVLRTVNSGYVLRVEPGERDVDAADERIAAGRAALAQGDADGAVAVLADALSLWRGPPLADLTFADFAQSEILRLEELRLSALDARIEAELALGRHAELLGELEALVAEQPHHERFTVHLMHALYRCGRQLDALEAYHTFRRHGREVGLEPGPTLRQLETDVLNHAPALQWSGDVAPLPAPAVTALPRSRRATGGAFVGRDAALVRLHARWERCRAGVPGCVLVEGEPGVGKTRLSLHFADRQDSLTLYGRAEQEALRPFQPFAEALEQLLEAAGPDFQRRLAPELAVLVDLAPDLRTGDGAQRPRSPDRFALFQALVKVLAEASRTWPLLLVLDDLHWADKPTLLLIRHVLRHAGGSPLLIIGTTRVSGGGWLDQSNRPDELAAWRADLRREQLLDDVIEVGGLDPDETRKLVSDRLGAAVVTPDAVRRLHERTGGNAFFVEETLRSLGDLEPDTVVDVSMLERVGVPPSVREAILQRRRRLTPPAAKLLDTAAVLGAVDLETLADLDLLEASTTDIVAAAEEIQDGGFAQEVPSRGDLLVFPHDVVREVIYESLSLPRRQLLHHEIGRTLEGRPDAADPAELAYHFYEACRLAASPAPARYAEPARRYKVLAGQSAERQYAYEEAARHFVDALELSSPGDDAGRCQILLGLGRVRSLAGGTLDADRLWQIPARARDAYLEAFRCAERSGNAAQLAEAALGVGERYFEMTYSDSDHLHLLERALETVDSDSARAMLLARLAANRGFPHESAEADERAQQAESIARRLGKPHLLFAVLLARHVTLSDVEHLPERLAIADELSSLAPPRPEFAAELCNHRMYNLLELGDIDGARAAHEQLADIARSLGQPLYLSIVAGARGLFAELDGDLAGAERCAEESRRHSASARMLDATSAWAGQVYRRRLIEHDPARMSELAVEVEELVRGGGHKLGWRCGLGVLRFELGDVDTARRLYELDRRHYRLDERRLPRGMFRLSHAVGLAQLARRLQDANGARRLYEDLWPVRERNIVVSYCSFWGSVEGFLGQLAATFGDLELAAAHTDRALQRARELGAPLLADELEDRLERLSASSRRWSAPGAARR
jgi:DNA-binding SARP family transcriptional activator